MAAVTEGQEQVGGEGGGGKTETQDHLPAGYLMVEQYSWTGATCHPLLRITTTGIAGEVFSLPPGYSWPSCWSLSIMLTLLSHSPAASMR